MRNNALYFPYINVPKSEWFFRVLLYWDQVGSIVPIEVMERQDDLTPHMRALVNEGLVTPIYPGQFIEHQELFSQIFIDYIKSRPNFQYSINRQRLQRVHLEKMGSRVHIEKLDTLADALVQIGVAERVDFSWYALEPWVADAYMTYLATYLGSLREISATPVTNSIKSYETLMTSPRLLGRNSRRNTVIPIRQILLGRLLPIPRIEDQLSELIEFKEQYGDQLGAFRNLIEDTCIDLANIGDEELREVALERELQRLEEGRDAISDGLRTDGYEVFYGALLPVMASVASIAAVDPSDPPLRWGAGVAGGVISLMTAIYQAIKTSNAQSRNQSGPLAYAAFATKQFQI
jgi:hypothetical protein